MFWDGTRWIDERTLEPKPVRKSRRVRDWIATGVIIAGLVAATIPFAAVSAAETPQSLINSWKLDYSTTVVQESSRRIRYRGTWSVAKHPKYLNGLVRRSNQRGASASIAFKGTGISWVGPKGPTRGRARVYVDGKLSKTVNLWASGYVPNRVLYTVKWADMGSHSLKIVVLGTAGHPTVAIDAFVVRGAAKVDISGSKAGKAEVAPSPTVEPSSSVEPGPVAETSPSPTATAPLATSTPTSAPEPSPTPTPTPTPAPTQSTTGCSTLQARIDAAPTGSVLDLTGCTYSGRATVNKSLTLRGATVNVPAGGAGITVTADNVTIDDVAVTGAQASTYVSSEKCISAPGSSSNTIDRLTIRNSTIRRCGYGGVYLRYATAALVDGNTIEDSVYAGILMASVKSSTISDNVIRRVGMKGNSVHENNAYGITATYEGSGAMSADLMITRNTVEYVPTWHGLDTHGGIRIRYEQNTVRAARRAAFLTGGPTDVVFTGNTIIAPTTAQQDACPSDTPLAYCRDIRGITLVGADGATVTNNTGSGWGSDWYNDYGGNSTGVVLSGNTVN